MSINLIWKSIHTCPSMHIHAHTFVAMLPSLVPHPNPLPMGLSRR